MRYVVMKDGDIVYLVFVHKTDEVDSRVVCITNDKEYAERAKRVLSKHRSDCWIEEKSFFGKVVT